MSGKKLGYGIIQKVLRNLCKDAGSKKQKQNQNFPND